jgi:lactate dehydrogenase-like 2-hydroxyacid dehydrogenase
MSSTAANKPKVLLALPLPQDLEARVASRCATVVAPSGYFLKSDELEALLPSVDGVISTVMPKFHGALLARCPNLKVISNCAVGTDNVDIAAAVERRIAVCNVPGVSEFAIADLAIGLMLALARNIVGNDRFVRSGAWLNEPPALTINTRGKTLALLGLGRIGAIVARNAAALGLKVIYFKRNRDLAAEAAGIASFATRDELFRRADFLSLHLPLTEETRGSIGARELGLMKRGAFLINTARGAIVDEFALADCLKREAIAGAALDVMVEEPLPPTSPLCALPNVVLQPHVGSATIETRRALEEASVANLLAVLAGQRPRFIVNPEVLS